MIIESLVGSLLGGAFRLAPEILKFFDRKNERAHEVTMLDKQNTADQARAASQERQLEVQAQMTQMAGALSALREALTGQFQKTGIKWVDAMNVTVRPVITYAFFALYGLVKIAVFVALVKSGAGWGTAVQAVWTEADMALWSGIVNFYFLGRVFEKGKG